jgi:hypothetical protein
MNLGSSAGLPDHGAAAAARRREGGLVVGEDVGDA